jgi:multiple sugar transport system substrate-binding protein
MKRLGIYLTVVMLLILTGCSDFPVLFATPTGRTTLPNVSSAPPTSTQVPITPTPSPLGPVRLRLWVPPFLNPSSEGPAGNLLKKRLEEFQSHNPNLIIETRVKSVYGSGGLLDSIATANAAAPAALPDLVALPRDLEEAAALKGLLLPLDNLNTSLIDPDWYPFASELAHLQNNLYGFPFAGDALVQIYSTTQITRPLTSWNQIINAGHPFIFPAATDNPLFTLAQYQANGGAFRDEQGRPTLDATKLSQVLSFYQQATQSGVMQADLLTQIQNDDQAWDAFIEDRGGSVATWSSRYLSSPVQDRAITQIPTPQGRSFTLATGWVWSLVGREEEKRHLAIELAEFLVDSHFLADWSQTAGYLPTRPSSLSLWTQGDLQQAVGEITTSARLFPPTDVLSTLGVPLQQATLSVLKDEADPASAAQTASVSLTSP